MTPCIRSSALALTRRTIVLRSWCSVSPCDICIIEKCMSNQPSRRHLTTRNTVPPHLKPNFKTTLNGSTTPNAADTTQHKNDRNITPPAQPPVVDRHHSHPDGLTRYPSLRSPNGMLRGLDWLGTVSFAASGTIVAGYAGMDSLGCTIVGTITAMGGGTIRDILLGNFPVFWMHEVEYLWLALVTVAGTFLFFNGEADKNDVFGENGTMLYVTDSVGLGAFAVIGAQNAIRMQLPRVVCVVCGMITATFGGLIRDVLCCKPARIVHSHAELYGVTALAGASFYVGMRHFCLSPTARICGGVLTGVLMRHWASTHNVTLPVASWYGGESCLKERAGKDFDK